MVSFIETICGMTHPLRSYRLSAGLTLASLATQAGLPKSVLSKIENRAVSPTMSTVAKIVVATNGAVTANDFMPSEETAA